MTNRFDKHIKIDSADITALEHLAAHTPLSKQQIKLAMKNGCVWLESAHGIMRLRRVKKILLPDDHLHIYYDEAIQHTRPPTATLIADEGVYSIWNKPYGMYSQGSKWGDHCSLYRWAEQNLTPERPAFPVHRLDRAASGLMILAHSKKLAASFSELFKTRNIQKQYKACVEGRLDNLTLPYNITQDIDGKTARSTILFIEPQKNNLENSTENSSEVIIEIETGRKHQIRKHLASLGHPILGDRLYGTKDYSEDLQLQSYSLAFNCPVSGTLKKYKLEE